MPRPMPLVACSSWLAARDVVGALQSICVRRVLVALAGEESGICVYVKLGLRKVLLDKTMSKLGRLLRFAIRPIRREAFSLLPPASVTWSHTSVVTV